MLWIWKRLLVSKKVAKLPQKKARLVLKINLFLIKKEFMQLEIHLD